MNKPIVGIPLGDVAGIGPEIVVKALSNPEMYEICRPVVIGEYRSLVKAIKVTKVNIEINTIKTTKDGVYKCGNIDLIDLNNIPEEIEYGKVNGLAGKAAFEFIEKSVELGLKKEIDVVATTPINKESLRAGKINYIGHTEIYGGLTNVKDPLTMFQVKNLRVFFLSRHLSLSKAIEAITEERVHDYLVRCNESLIKLGIKNPLIAVAGLNPHCGEHGLFGNEEELYIEPGIKRANEQGIKVKGPIGADSVFYLALKGKYDAVLSLYHDQGHIATKTLDFERTISLTIGLPFLRTSVDHGTAFDIAGKNIASAVSMEEAIRLAAHYGPLYKLP